MMQQGVRCCISGVGHPQTQGKVERWALEQARRRPGGQRWAQIPRCKECPDNDL
jgi:transposase InsO family protein